MPGRLHAPTIRLSRARRTGKSVLVKIVGGTHSGFTDVDGHLAPAALARQQALVARYATAFMKRYLAREPSFGRFLTAADAADRGTDVAVTARLR